MKHRLHWLSLVLSLPLLLGGAASAYATSAAHQGSHSFITDIAKHLGVPEQKLKDAVQRAHLDRVRILLRQGRITQEQATEMERAIRTGRLEGVRMHPRGRMWGRAMVSDAAAYLELTPDAFRARLKHGQSPAVIAKAQGKLPAGLEQTLLNRARKRIASQVQAGRLTREQGASMQSKLAAHVHRFVTGSWQSKGMRSSERSEAPAPPA